MKKITLLLLLSISCLPAFPQEALKIVYFNNFPPYSWEVDGKMQGLFIDIMNEALTNRMNIKISHSGYPWARAQSLVESGAADAFVTFPSEARKAYTQVSQQEVIRFTNTLFTRAKHPKLKQMKKVSAIKQLKGFQLVDYVGNGWAKQNLKGLDVNWLARFEQILPILVKGRADLHVGASRMVRYNIKTQRYKNRVIELPTILGAASAHLCISKRSDFSQVLPEFDNVVEQMKKEGVLKQMSEAYQ